MTDISLQVLSNEIKISINTLIKELSNIGIIKNQNNYINEHEKILLLKHLQSKNQSSLKTLILQRKIRTTLNVSTLGGKNKSVPIEVRKKRTYVKQNKIEKESILRTKKITQNLLTKDVLLDIKDTKVFKKKYR